jgi:hypothetical protein
MANAELAVTILGAQTGFQNLVTQSDPVSQIKTSGSNVGVRSCDATFHPIHIRPLACSGHARSRTLLGPWQGMLGTPRPVYLPSQSPSDGIFGHRC